MNCPRRYPPIVEGEDSVFMYGTTDTWREDDTCSYCGGTKVDKIIEMLKNGATLTPTDKSYKYYVNKLGSNDSYSRVKLYIQHCSKEQIDELNIIRLGYK